MRTTFNDEESFKEVVGSLCFNNPSSETDSVTEVLQVREVGYEKNEDICLNNSPNDPNSLG